MTQNHEHHNCIHCGCNSPVIKLLDDTIRNHGKEIQVPPTQKLPEAKPTIFRGGNIYIFNEEQLQFQKVDAIGIAGGKVVATGEVESVNETMTRENTIDLIKKVELEDGQTLIPGMIEPHAHIVPTALILDWLDFGPFAGQSLREIYDESWLVDQLKSALSEMTEEGKENRWLLARGLDPALLPFQVRSESCDPKKLNELVTIDLEWFDRLAKTTPEINTVPILILSASMHTFYANKCALDTIYAKAEKSSEEWAKQFRDNYKSPEEYIQKTNGQLQELENQLPAFLSISDIQKIEMVVNLGKNIPEFLNQATGRGITMLYDAGMTEKNLDIFNIVSELSQEPLNARIRIGYAYLCESAKEADSLPPYRAENDPAEVYQGNVKIVSDGSNQGLTGFQNTQYCCAPDANYGVFNFHSPEIKTQPDNIAQTGDFQQILETVIGKKKWPVMIHANGEKALDFTLEGFSEVFHDPDSGITQDENRKKRHRIEHASLLTADRLDRMKEMGISPSFLIGHVGFWGFAFQKAILGEERTELLDPAKSALKKEMKITLHSDCGVTPLGVLRLMEQAITRKMEGTRHKNGEGPFNRTPSEIQALNPEERITRREALQAATYNAAWQCHVEKSVGTLQEGTYADFVILDEDPLAETTSNHMNISAVGMRNIPVLETWKGGVRVYRSRGEKMSTPVLKTGEQEATLTALYSGDNTNTGPEIENSLLVYRLVGKNATSWWLNREEVQQILDTKDVSVTDTTFSIGIHKNWLYSRSCFKTPDDLINEIYDLLHFVLEGTESRVTPAT